MIYVQQAQGVKMKKHGILVVSVGTTCEDAEEKSITALERKVAHTYPDRQVFRGYTSQMVRQVLESRGRRVPSVSEALEEMEALGITHTAILPTHVIYGEEYEKLVQLVETKRKQFAEVVIAKPLIAGRSDMMHVAHILRQTYVKQPDMALVMMGHGTYQAGNVVYETMECVCRELGCEDMYLGTVRSYPGIDVILKKVTDANIKKVILLPFMFVAGAHVRRDMIGEKPDSWRSRLEQHGLEVTAVLKGLGEYEEIQMLYCKHLQDVEKKMLTNEVN